MSERQETYRHGDCLVLGCQYAEFVGESEYVCHGTCKLVEWEDERAKSIESL